MKELNKSRGPEADAGSCGGADGQSFFHDLQMIQDLRACRTRCILKRYTTGPSASVPSVETRELFQPAIS